MGYFVQVEFPLTQEFEVNVRFENSKVFGKRQSRTRMLSPDCAAWLEKHGGDWGLINWEVVDYNYMHGPFLRYQRVGRTFQFADRRVAQLFLLIFDCFREVQEHVTDASSA